MNIFVVDKNPVIAAQMLCDKHVVKMVLETAQMLCTVAHRHGYSKARYKKTHQHHPCTVWAGDSQSNYNWLTRHGLALCAEYTKRYEKRHKSQDIIEWCQRNVTIPDQGLTPFKMAMPDKYKQSNITEAYRNYYRGEKAKIAKWKHGSPRWWKEPKL